MDDDSGDARGEPERPSPSLAEISEGRSALDAERRVRFGPRAVAATYAGLGALWILASDMALEFLVGREFLGLIHTQTIKGWFFIAVTALSLYLILMHFHRRLSARKAQIESFETAFRDHAESASDWLWEMGPDLRLTRITGRFRDLTGMDPGQFIGKTREEIFAPAADPALREAHLADLRARRPFRDMEYPYVHADGSTRYMRISGKPVFGPDGGFLGYRGAGSDVTERRRARLARDRLAAIVEASQDFIALFKPDGSARYVNPAGRRKTGIDAAAPAAGVDLFALFTDAEARRLREQALPAASGAGSWRGEMEMRATDGALFPASVMVLAHRNGGGAPVNYSLIARDMTEQRRAEERLRTAQKMEALGQLTGGVAHDFNNDLTVILGNAESLAARLDDGDLRPLAEMITAAAERGAALTSRLLSFARRQNLTPEPVDVAALAAGMTALLRRTLGEAIDIRIVAGQGLRPALADPAQLESAILNLALNARDAMPGGGNLFIELGQQTLSRGQDAELPPGDYVVLSVTDTGRGMPPEIARQAFEPFFTTKPQGEGSGLGLSMVFGFAQQSGGRARIDSTLGQGTTVALWLPAADAAAPAARSGGPAAGDLRGGGEKVLMVEDDDLVREHVAGELENLGYAVLAARNGREALDMLRAGAAVDLLFTDVVMPGGMNGVQLADAARALRPGLPVMFTSGYAADALTHDERAQPALLVLKKPYRRQDLAAMLRQALGGARPGMRSAAR
ncbi:MAG: PAS domain S-box protein [Maricaulaceae bacterium]|nr:PAS domain S-box protein [Maricaulaceae bacterium]